MEWFPIVLFAAVCLCLMLGYPVAFTLGGVSLIFAGIGIVVGSFDPSLLKAFPDRLYGIMTNFTLLAVPLFVLMGVLLEKSRLAEELLDTMGRLCGRLPGGLGISVILVGMLMAASTGIVGATVVTMGLMSLPAMLRRGYDPALACGTICATGTLGQIIPPSIALVLLGDVLSNAYQKAMLSKGIYDATPVSVGDLFIGALIPGMLLVSAYLLYMFLVAWRNPHLAPAVTDVEKPSPKEIVNSLVPPLGLIIIVLGSILSGFATPTEAAAVGALGAAVLTWIKGALTKENLRETITTTTYITAMVFGILIGASLFSLVFRGFGGEHLIETFLSDLPGGVFGAMLLVMLLIFLLGFILDFIEITFVVVPIIGPVLLAMGLNPIWLGVMLAVNLQTSFITPPFGFSLFYLRGVAPETIPTGAIYRGVIPFIVIQLLALIALAIWPEIATFLPQAIAANS